MRRAEFSQRNRAVGVEARRCPPGSGEGKQVTSRETTPPSGHNFSAQGLPLTPCSGASLARLGWGGGSILGAHVSQLQGKCPACCTLSLGFLSGETKLLD